MNILSLKNTKTLYRITYDSMSGDGGHFVVHRHMGPIIFQQSHCRLYFHDMRESKTIDFKQYDVETVADNAKGFTCCQLHSAHSARRLQCMTGHPYDAALLALIR